MNRNVRQLTTMWFITKTCLYICDPLKPHFYIVKLGFTGVYIIFLIFAQNIDCGYSLEPPRRGGSNEYPQSMFWAEVWKISVFYLKFFNVLEVKVSIYLNRRVFVMYSRTAMARTSLGPWKFVRDMGSSSHWGLIMAPSQEANGDNLGKSSTQ